MKKNKKKLKLKVPVSWEMKAMVEVEATDLAEAVEVAKADFAQYGGEFLPKGKFVENSYHVEFEAIDVHQDAKTLDKMYEQMDEMYHPADTHMGGEHGIGGYIDSEGTVYTDEQSGVFLNGVSSGLTAYVRNTTGLPMREGVKVLPQREKKGKN